jgi:hypothetical protein
MMMLLLMMMMMLLMMMLLLMTGGHVMMLVVCFRTAALIPGQGKSMDFFLYNLGIKKQNNFTEGLNRDYNLGK